MPSSRNFASPDRISRVYAAVPLQGVVLRMATFVVLRYGSTLSKISVHRFFTLCWMRISRACARWRSLRTAASSREAPSAELGVQQPLLQGS